MDWIRGETVGHGSFGRVSRVAGASPAMVVKSCSASYSASLLNEKKILDELRDCPEIIRCFGDSYSFENGEKLYNVLLEFASRGSLADKFKDSGNQRLPEFETRGYTKALLRGLRFIHQTGYVHCDVKLDNILLGEDGRIKIADFGLAKRFGGGENNLGCELRGTPMYMSPEMVTGCEQGPAADIWALGCAVAEMVTGAPAWNCSNLAALLMRIGVGEEVPEIPGDLSSEIKDFVGKCFLKDPRKRWTAEMLLNHPFVADHHDDDGAATVTLKESPVPSTSPRCPFDFPDWTSESSVSCSITSLPSPLSELEHSRPTSPAARLRGLVSDHLPNWSEVAHGWICVR